MNRRIDLVMACWVVVAVFLIVEEGFSQAEEPHSLLDSLNLRSQDRSDLGSELPVETVAVLGSYRGRHTEAAKCLAVSPDGKWIASGSRDQTVRLWDPKTLKPIRVLNGAEDDVDAVAFTADSKSLLAVSGDRMLRIWNLANADAPPQTLPLDLGAKPFISPDGSTIAVHSHTQDQQPQEVFHVIAFANGALKTKQGPLHGLLHFPECLVLSKSGRWLATGCHAYPNGEVDLWDLTQQDEKPHWNLEDPKRRVVSLAFSPDETRILVGRDDGVIAIWKLKECSPVKTIELAAHTESVSAVVFSPNGQKLVTGSYDHDIVIWNWNEGAPKRIDSLSGHKGWIGALAFSPDGNVLYSAGWSHTIRRRVAKGDSFEATNDFEGHSHPVQSMAFSKDDKLLATGAISDIKVGQGEPNEVRIWKFGERQPKQETTLDGCTSWITDLAFSHDGEMLAAASGSGANLWSVGKWTSVATLRPGKNGPFAKAVAFAPDRRVLAAGWTSPPRLDLIDFQSQPEKTLITTEEGVYHPHLSLSSNGQLLALASENDPSIYLLEPQDGKFAARAELEGTESIDSIAWSPSAAQIASGHRDGTAHFWKLGENNATTHEVLRGHNTVVARLDFGSNGRVLASGDWNGNLKLWDVAQTKVTDEVDNAGADLANQISP